MSWRNILISKNCKLSHQLNYLQIRYNNKDEKQHILLNEISTIIVESTSVSITTSLINECCKHKIKLIFCDERHNPTCEIMNYYGSHDSSKRIRKQISWNPDTAAAVWREIIIHKILTQAQVLRLLNRPEENILLQYAREVEPMDITNREAHAAKVYFNSIFGNDFHRDLNCVHNLVLNYGYSVILSAFNREIVKCGYLTEIGIFQHNQFNNFNLSCDFMEPFRALFDIYYLNSDINDFNSETKLKIVDFMSSTVKIGGIRHYVNDAIGRYTKSLLDVLDTGNLDEIKFFDNEL